MTYTVYDIARKVLNDATHGTADPSRVAYHLTGQGTLVIATDTGQTFLCTFTEIQGAQQYVAPALLEPAYKKVTGERCHNAHCRSTDTFEKSRDYPDIVHAGRVDPTVREVVMGCRACKGIFIIWVDEAQQEKPVR